MERRRTPESEGVERRWRSQRAYDDEASFFGNGRYPPDWNRRRRAVWRAQDDECARCRRDVSTHNRAAHHHRPLSKGGSNELANLVGLCGECHALMHPGNDDEEFMAGNWRDAPTFPAADADPRVAVVRRGVRDDEADAAAKLRVLAAASQPNENEQATTPATYSLSPADALDAERHLDDLVAERGLALTNEARVCVRDGAGSALADRRVRLRVGVDGGDTTRFDAWTDADGVARSAVPDCVSGIRATADLDGESEPVLLDHDPDGDWTGTIEAARVGGDGSGGGGGGGDGGAAGTSAGAAGTGTATGTAASDTAAGETADDRGDTPLVVTEFVLNLVVALAAGAALVAGAAVAGALPASVPVADAVPPAAVALVGALALWLGVAAFGVGVSTAVADDHDATTALYLAPAALLGLYWYAATGGVGSAAVGVGTLLAFAATNRTVAIHADRSVPYPVLAGLWFAATACSHVGYVAVEFGLAPAAVAALVSLAEPAVGGLHPLLVAPLAILGASYLWYPLRRLAE